MAEFGSLSGGGAPWFEPSESMARVGAGLGNTWPAHLAEALLAAVKAPGDALMGNLQVPAGLRREDFTDIPATGSFGSFGSQPMDNAVERSTDLAGALMSGTLGAPAGAVGSGFTKPAKPIRAYHGSPHDFDKFDLAKVGTGEGAQSYGHGLYFAENEAVAKSYRDKLASHNYNDPTTAAAAYLKDAGGDRTKALATMRDHAADPFWVSDAKMATSIREGYELLKRGDPLPSLPDPGRMYEVNLNANPERFLDWDKPLKSQAVAETVSSLVPNDLRKPFEHNVASGISGANAYYNYIPSQSFAIRPTVGKPFGPSGAKTFEEALKLVGGDPLLVRTVLNPDKAGASAALRDAGIPGIKYLDQGSRSAGDGTSNYVVFDPSIVEILKKYGLAGLTAGGLGGATTFGSMAPQQQ